MRHWTIGFTPSPLFENLPLPPLTAIRTNNIFYNPLKIWQNEIASIRFIVDPSCNLTKYYTRKPQNPPPTFEQCRKMLQIPHMVYLI